MHHLALVLALGVPLDPGGPRCCGLNAYSTPMPGPTTLTSTTPVSTLVIAPAPRVAVVPKYGPLTARPSSRPIGVHPALTGDGPGPDPANLVLAPIVRGGLWRAAASVFRLTARPGAAPLGGPIHR